MASRVNARTSRWAQLAISIAILSVVWVMGRASVANCGTTTFTGLAPGDSAFGPCTSSSYDQSCPNPNPLCLCYGAIGNVSGAAGSGYAEVDINEDFNPTAGCFQFNASMFTVGYKDVEQVDFSGSDCERHNDRRRVYEGTYRIVRSAEGRTGSGRVSGSSGAEPVFHFTEER